VEKSPASFEQGDEATVPLKFDPSGQIEAVAHRLGLRLPEPATGWAPQAPFCSVFAVAGISQRNSMLGASEADQEKPTNTAPRQKGTESQWPRPIHSAVHRGEPNQWEGRQNVIDVTTDSVMQTD
jgi:hypothetical protein